MGLTRPRAYQIFDLDYKQSVRVISLSNITLSGGAPTVVDGVTLSANDRILVAGQSDGAENGLYYVTTLGTGSNGTWSRSIDGDQTGEIDAGMIVMVTEGGVYADTQWKLTTNDPITIGTTALTFEQNSAFAFGNIYANGTAVLADIVGDTVTFTPANNLIITGNASSDTITFEVSQSPTFTGTVEVTGNVNANNITLVNDISANVFLGSVANVALVLTDVANVVNDVNVGGSIQTTGNITGGNINTAGQVVATGNITGGNINTAGQVVATGNITGGNLITLGTLSTTSLTASGNISGGNINTAGQLKSTGTFVIGSQQFYAQGNDGFSVNENFNAGNSTVTAYHYTSGSGRNAIVFDTAVTGQFTTGFGTTGTAASNKFVFFAEFGNTFWEWRKSVGIQAPNLNGGTLLANISADGNFWTAGTITGTGNITGGNITTAGQIVATGNVTGGNINTAGQVVASGNITADYFFGNVSQASGIFTTKIFNGTSEANIVSSGGNLAITIGGTSDIVVVSSAGLETTGTLTATGNVTGGNIVTAGQVVATGNVAGGNLSGTNIAGTLTTAAQTNITSVGTLGSLSVTGNIESGNVSGTRGAFTNIAGTLETASQPNITSVGTLTSLDVSGNAVIGGDLTVNGNTIYVNITDLNVQDPIIGLGRGENNAPLTSDDGKDRGEQLWYYTSAEKSAFIGYDNSADKLIAALDVSVSGEIVTVNSYGNFVVGGLEAATGSFTGNVDTGNISGTTGTFTNVAGTLTTAAQPNVTSLGTLSSLTVTANVTGGNLVTAGQVSATGNVNGNFFVGNGSALTGINSFGTIVVAGQDDVVANNTSAGLTLVAGDGVIITTAAGTDTITIATSGSAESIFISGGDMGTVDEAVTAEEDLGTVDVAVDIEIDMGTIVTAGIFYPDQLVFPSYTVAELANLSATPAGQMVYCSNESGGSVPAFSDGTDWRRVTDRAVVT